MKTRTLLLFSLPFMIIYIALSISLRTSEAIWLLTRVFGLLSYAFLFMTLLLGEVRMLSKVKGDAPLFRFHTPLAIFTTFLVALHFISAAAERYKWGVGLSFTDYLGAAFGDKWLVLLSMGTLAFYLMLLIGATSSSLGMRVLRYKRWKVVHFLSYLVFFIAYVHSVNLGTDIKTSILAPFIKPLILASFVVILAMLLTRVLKGLRVFRAAEDAQLAAVFFIILIGGAVIGAAMLQSGEDRVSSITADIAATRSDVDKMIIETARIGDLNTQIQRQVEQTVLNNTLLQTGGAPNG